MKKNIRFLLMGSLFLSAVFSGGACAAQAEIMEVEQEYAPPLVSFGQVVEAKDAVVQAKNNFIFWLGQALSLLIWRAMHQAGKSRSCEPVEGMD